MIQEKDTCKQLIKILEVKHRKETIVKERRHFDDKDIY